VIAVSLEKQSFSIAQFVQFFAGEQSPESSIKLNYKENQFLIILILSLPKRDITVGRSATPR
jgi:hypothetical protein